MSKSTLVKSHKCFNGSLQFHKHVSKTLHLSANFAIYEPPQANINTKLPAIFTLAGLTCNEQTFLIKSGAVREAARYGLYLIAIDTSPRGCHIEGEDDDWDFGSGAGFYLDATQAPWSQHYKMGTYLRSELPQLLQGMFNIDMGRCGIMGHSMGGHGALVHALRDPKFWKSVSAFAPITHPCVVPWGQKAFKNYLGNDKDIWRAHDTVCLLEDGHHFPQPILVDQGLEDPFLKKELQPWNLQKIAQQVKQPLELREHPGYDHSYWFVQSFIEDHMRHHASILCSRTT